MSVLKCGRKREEYIEGGRKSECECGTKRELGIEGQ